MPQPGERGHPSGKGGNPTRILLTDHHGLGKVTVDYENSKTDVAVFASSRRSQEKANELADMAIELAESKVEPSSALSALRDLGPSRKEADMALGLLRLGYFPFELRDANTAWRYLVAVKHGQDVEPPSDEQLLRMDRFEEFVGLDRADGFATLAGLEPRLDELENQVRRDSANWDSTGLVRDGFRIIDELLAPVVGPGSNQPDELLCSEVARHCARYHLIDVARLLDD